jgi:hypothetical protein
MKCNKATENLKGVKPKGTNPSHNKDRRKTTGECEMF